MIVEDGERRLKALQGVSSDVKGLIKKSDEIKKTEISVVSSSSDQDSPSGERDTDDLNVQVSIRRPPISASQIEAETASRLRELDAIFAQVSNHKCE